MDPTLAMADAPEHNRYEARAGDELVGFIDYTPGGELITFTYTEVDPAYAGQGVGGRLVRAALEDVRVRGRSVVPECGFVREWIDRHPEYAGLVHTDDSTGGTG